MRLTSLLFLFVFVLAQRAARHVSRVLRDISLMIHLSVRSVFLVSLLHWLSYLGKVPETAS